MRHSSVKVGVIIPTYNAAYYLPKLADSLTVAGVAPVQVLIIDSSSSDATRDIAQQRGYQVVCIPKEEFNHGGTRQLATSYLPDCEHLIFCTQDVILHGALAIDSLCAALDDPDVGAAYGRQFPRKDAGPLERYARLFNYPETSQVRTFADRFDLGIKTVFMSDSFAIYRRSALDSIGGFPLDILIAEDSVVAAKMLLAGWKIAYQASAAVIHSHPVDLGAQFRRYFDIGAQHARSAWMMKAFGSGNAEGKKYFKSEMRYILSCAPMTLPLALLNTATKFVGYHLGSVEHLLPLKLKVKLSGAPQFWLRLAKQGQPPGIS